MAFNHYAKLKNIIGSLSDGWFIRRIDEKTTAKNFNGETISYDYYYRLFDASGEQVKYGKFQKIDKLASILDVEVEDLPVID
jgi:hypothetical protein